MSYSYPVSTPASYRTIGSGIYNVCCRDRSKPFVCSVDNDLWQSWQPDTTSGVLGNINLYVSDNLKYTDDQYYQILKVGAYPPGWLK